MKQSEVKVGGRYVAKVSGRLQIVEVERIASEWDSLAGGRDSYGYRGQMRWRAHARNVKTGRAVLIRSAQRLRREVEEDPPCLCPACTDPAGQGVCYRRRQP